MGERTVNQRQLEVLEWIVAGCPPGGMSGTTHKTTAIALQNRRLATVTRRRGTWKAEATDAGRYFVKHGEYPDGHWRAPNDIPIPRVTPRAAPLAADRRPALKVTGLRPVDQMLADLAKSDGEMHVEASEHGLWENLVSAANRYKKVPDGKLLTIVRGDAWSERIIRLENLPDSIVQAIPVAVSEQLRSPHPAIRALRDNKERLPMKREVRSRALRILDAIAKAGVARGYAVGSVHAASGYHSANGHLEITIGRHPNTLIVDELNDRVPHEPTQQELREQERYSWKQIPSHDPVPSGRLRIRFERGWRVLRDSYSDTKTIRLEDRLSDVLEELALRAVAAEEQEQRREREREERAETWARVRDEAIVQAREHFRSEVLAAQVEDWHQAVRLGEFIAAMEAHLANDGTIEDPSGAAEWLAWANQRRWKLDPFAKLLGPPPDPEFTPDRLAPHMRGLSPYGPT